MFALPGLATAQTAYEQEGQDFDPTGLAESIIVDVLGEEKSADIDQNIEQPVTREISQDVDQSEENEQDNDNTQTQTAAIAQDIEQGLANGDDSARQKLSQDMQRRTNMAVPALAQAGRCGERERTRGNK